MTLQWSALYLPCSEAGVGTIHYSSYNTLGSHIPLGSWTYLRDIHFCSSIPQILRETTPDEAEVSGGM